MRSLGPHLHLYQGLMDGFLADDMDKGKGKGGGPREPLPGQDQGFGLQRDGNQGGHLRGANQGREVHLHDGPQQEQMFWGMWDKVQPQGQDHRTPVGQAHGGGEVF